MSIITILIILLVLSMFAWGPSVNATYLGPRNVVALLFVVILLLFLFGGFRSHL